MKRRTPASLALADRAGQMYAGRFGDANSGALIEQPVSTRSKTLDAPIRIGISRCLLGERVRYDGGHKHDHFLTDTLGRYFQWVPVCPEVEIGLGTPREPIHLVQLESASVDTSANSTATTEVRLVGVTTGRSHSGDAPLCTPACGCLGQRRPVRLRAQERFAKLRHAARQGASGQRSSHAQRPGAICTGPARRTS